MAASKSPRKLIVLCDGTGNQIDSRQSNVLRLYRMLKKNAAQRVFYDPGIGSISSTEDWTRWKANTESVLALITGYGLDRNVLNAYEFLRREYLRGDEIYLFGYSRGAYTVRVLAGFINAVGILHKDQQHLLNYAFRAYKQISEGGQFDTIRQFERILRPHRPPIRFMGLWDTVSSVIIPRSDRLYLPARRQLAYTERNPSVETVCHAFAIDEQRRMFRPYLWREGQDYWGGPFKPKDPERIKAQQLAEVWFPGVHSDVGGGYVDEESGLSLLSLRWMTEQLGDLVGINAASRKMIFGGNGEAAQTEADATAMMHDSMSLPWSVLEYLPKSVKYREQSHLRALLGCYVPAREARYIPGHADLHWSVRARMNLLPDYRPVNLPGYNGADAL